MRRLEVDLDWGSERRHVGTLAETERRIYFEYSREFLAEPLPLSPFRLPVQTGVFEDSERTFGGLHGVFNDSLPDGWGLLLMDREFQRKGVPVHSVTPLDRLAYIGSRAMGALAYRPPDDGEADVGWPLDLADVAAQAVRLQEGSAEEVLPELRVAGGSPGGARPKVLVGFREQDGTLVSGSGRLPEGFRPYLVKFPAKEDVEGAGAVEFAYARMARDAGVEMPPVRLFEARDGNRYFGVERFDRDGGRRLHQHSLGGLLHASHRMPSMDYDGFLRATFVLTRDHAQVEQAFVRMVFNVVAHNRDDHVKNFSYLMMPDGEWTLAPAYDLVFSAGINGWHTTSVAGEAEHPGEEDMLRVAENASIPRSRATEVIRRARDVVGAWPSYADAAGVPGEAAARIQSALEHTR